MQGAQYCSEMTLSLIGRQLLLSMKYMLSALAAEGHLALRARGGWLQSPFMLACCGHTPLIGYKYE